MSPQRRLLSVPVPGGDLHVRVWEPSASVGSVGRAALCVHGITSTHMAFAPLVRHLPGWRVVAPDLRGRGSSRSLPEPYGMTAHADDLLRVLDTAGVDRATVVGHSMGGFVAVVLAHRHPDRVERLVLVDGGLPLPQLPGLDADEMLQAVIGPAAERLAMRFASVEEHREFWRRHPAFATRWTSDIEAYVDYDLVGTTPQLRSSPSYEAVRADSIDLHTGADFPAALAALEHPTTFLRAERGMLDQPDGLFDEESSAQAADAHGIDRLETVPGVNHYTIVLSEPGATALADVLEAGGAGANA